MIISARDTFALLTAFVFAQTEIAIDSNQPPTPSSTKPRFAPPFTGGKPGDLLSHKPVAPVLMCMDAFEGVAQADADASVSFGC